MKEIIELLIAFFLRVSETIEEGPMLKVRLEVDKTYSNPAGT